MVYLWNQVRYYGFYSNKKRGMREKKDSPKVECNPGITEGDATFVKNAR
jgi:hypothetical protein